MAEQRKVNRTHLIHYLKVINVDDDSVIGYLVDISIEGVLLRTKVPVAVDACFNCILQLNSSIDNQTEIGFRATCIWCKQESITSYHSVGLRIDEMNSEHERAMRLLIDLYGTIDLD